MMAPTDRLKRASFLVFGLALTGLTLAASAGGGSTSSESTVQEKERGDQPN